MGMRTVRDETLSGVSSPALMRAYRVGRFTPRNRAASVIERCDLPPKVSRAAIVSISALRACLRWRLRRMLYVLRQVSLQYLCLGFSGVKGFPQPEQVFIAMCILFTTFRRL